LIVRIRNPNPRICTSRLMKFNPSIFTSLLTLVVYKFLVDSLWNKILNNPNSERYWLLNGLEYRTSLCGDDNINTYFCCCNSHRFSSTNAFSFEREIKKPRHIIVQHIRGPFRNSIVKTLSMSNISLFTIYL